MFVFKGWFIGMQDTVRPMAVDIFVNVANIAASLFLAVRTPLGFAGVAWGTVFAQYSGLALSIILLLSKYRHVFKGVGLRESMGGGRLSSFFQDERQPVHRSVCIILVYIGFTTISARFGDELLAVGSILMKLLMIFFILYRRFRIRGRGPFRQVTWGDALRLFQGCRTPDFRMGSVHIGDFPFRLRYCGKNIFCS